MQGNKAEFQFGFSTILNIRVELVEKGSIFYSWLSECVFKAFRMEDNNFDLIICFPGKLYFETAQLSIRKKKIFGVCFILIYTHYATAELNHCSDPTTFVLYLKYLK